MPTKVKIAELSLYGMAIKKNVPAYDRTYDAEQMEKYLRDALPLPFQHSDSVAATNTAEGKRSTARSPFVLLSKRNRKSKLDVVLTNSRPDGGDFFEHKGKAGGGEAVSVNFIGKYVLILYFLTKSNVRTAFRCGIPEAVYESWPKSHIETEDEAEIKTSNGDRKQLSIDLLQTSSVIQPTETSRKRPSIANDEGCSVADNFDRDLSEGSARIAKRLRSELSMFSQPHLIQISMLMRS
jgi:hypothetical protein